MDNQEIDRLVAEKVMRYEIIPPSVHEGTGYENQGYFVVKEETEEEDAVWVSQPEFSPSTNIQDAWEVADKIYDWILLDYRIYKERAYGGRSSCVCEFYGYDRFRYKDVEHEAEAETIPLAICLAALKAVGIN